MAHDCLDPSIERWSVLWTQVTRFTSVLPPIVVSFLTKASGNQLGLLLAFVTMVGEGAKIAKRTARFPRPMNPKHMSMYQFVTIVLPPSPFALPASFRSLQLSRKTIKCRSSAEAARKTSRIRIPSLLQGACNASKYPGRNVQKTARRLHRVSSFSSTVNFRPSDLVR